ncbi:microcompartment protein CcmL/EutN [Hydrogenispora ethanolica]|uniref:Microcompartment protein CcmL/EutN n=1 Tax=Hydrogenispora ethanolica TaxID=1082276 RepID=A0A4R1R842_HYDET|nr:BMC domain-containing protein [Hydrogenispora ethanolica]TCL61512.1 microcompartment protein CcmL/EutN [Hydrogenispora ethanolica]
MNNQGQAIGLLEWKSIVLGVKATDALLKTAAVELLQAGSVCPGKYIALFGGEVGAVQSALEVAVRESKGDIVDQFLLARVDPALFPALAGATDIQPGGSLGIIETFSVAAAVQAADTAVKAAAVQLLEIRLARGMGGKSVVFFSGEVSAVRLAGEAAVKQVMESGMLLAWDVIPSPHPDLWAKLL